MSSSNGVSHALVVFGGSMYDHALTTGFVAISKKLIADGLQPTCISGTHIKDVRDIVNFFVDFWSRRP